MKTPFHFTKIYLYRHSVDMRKQIASLSVVVSELMEHSPFTDALFIFVSKNRKCIKAIYWDRSGFALWQKRSEKQKFFWPVHLEGKNIELSANDVEMVLNGVDLLNLRGHKKLSFEKNC